MFKLTNHRLDLSDVNQDSFSPIFSCNTKLRDGADQRVRDPWQRRHRQVLRPLLRVRLDQCCRLDRQFRK